MPASLAHWLELGVEFLKLLTFFAVLVSPACWVSVRRIPNESIVARIALGVAAGFGLFVVSAWYLAWWSLSVPLGFWLLQAVAALWLGRRDVLPSQQPDPAGSRGDRPGLLLIPIVAIVLVQAYPLSLSQLPPGADASFHCTVGLRQLTAGRATLDLRPLEALELNYPIGSHLWLAIAAKWTGLEVHQVFRHSFALVLSGTALLIAAWAERMFNQPGRGLAAATALLICTYHVSLLPYTWGGLPSLIAMWQGMAALYGAVFLPRRIGFVLGAVLFGSTALVHHHTMVALWAGVGAVAVWIAITCKGWRGPALALLLALVGGVLVASIYAVPLALRASRIDDTSVLRFGEPFHWPWEELWSWGPGLLITAAIGLLTPCRPECRFGRRMLAGLVVFWLLAFCTLDYGMRLIAWCRGTSATQPFTPSRFLFDTQLALAVFSGLGLARIWAWLRFSSIRYAGILALCGWAIWKVHPQWRPVWSDVLIPLGSWAPTHLPENALVTGMPSLWNTYICQRESSFLFVPISESPDQEWTRRKSELCSAPLIRTLSEWEKLLNRPIFVINFASAATEQDQPLFVSGNVAVYGSEGGEAGRMSGD